MQNGVLDAADVLIDRQPFIDDLALGRRRRDPRIGEAREVPRRVDERIHRVGFAPRRPRALGTLHILPGRVTVERIARLVEGDILRQRHRQVFRRHGHDTAFLAVNDRDRATPVALA